jgi:creatinine amidohydrolase
LHGSAAYRRPGSAGVKIAFIGHMPRWETMTSAEIGAHVGAGRDLAILPVGATEQHGAHLATGTDTISAEEVAVRAAAEVGCLVLPALPYGCSLGHTHKWPGTISLHPTTLTLVVVEIARWAVQSGVRRLLFLSGHATNGPSLASAILQLRYELPEARFAQMALWDISARARGLYLRDGEDIHANRGETSVLLCARPDMVRMAEARDVDDVTPGLFWSYPMPRTTESGVVGRPTEASAEDGRLMIETMVADLAERLRQAAAEPWPEVALPHEAK